MNTERGDFMEKKRNWANDDKWKAMNTDRVNLRFFHTTDADILEALEGKDRGKEIRRLLRVAIAYEREQKEKERGE